METATYCYLPGYARTTKPDAKVITPKRGVGRRKRGTGMGYV